MNKYAQIFIGGAGITTLEWENIKSVIPDEGLKGIIIGWSENPDIYKAAKEYSKQTGTKLYLWLPVFAEFKQLTTQSGYILHNGLNVGSQEFTAEENFEFCCVSDTDNIEKLLTYYESAFSRYEFDGVFLDRIRYPSFTAGIDAFFGCSCSSCQSRFESFGLSKKDINDCIVQIKNRIADDRCVNPLGLKGYRGGKWEFDDQQLSQLLMAKADIVTGSVSRIAEGLRHFVPEIGLDLFAPFMSVFVGQSYDSLPKLADFIKPMLYRHTNTPAGFKFEISKMAEAVSTANTRLIREEFIRNLLGISEDGDMRSLMEAELITLKQLGTKVIPGIELHTAKGLPPISKNQISENIKMIDRYGFDGLTACWNILEASEANRRLFMDNGDE